MDADSPSGDVARWLSAARSGSPEALGRLLEACRGYLLLVAERELDPDLRAKGGASDLVQETFLEAQQDFGRFQGSSEGELLAWLRQILLNNLANFTRRFKATGKRRLAREVPLASLGSDPGAPLGLTLGRGGPEEQVIAREQEQNLQRALDRLPEDYRQVLLFRYREQLSFEEIGRRLGRSPNAARKLWVRAVDRLQQDLEPLA